jgi:phosphoribosylamine---glycine ligase
MFRHNIPTAAHRTFVKGQLKEAIEHLERAQAPYVIKADGLAAGKGVVITSDKKEAAATLKDMLEGGRFGAGRRACGDRTIPQGHRARPPS